MNDMKKNILNLIEIIKYLLFSIGTYLTISVAATFQDIYIKTFICLIGILIYFISYKFIDFKNIKNGYISRKKLIERESKYSIYWNMVFILIVIGICTIDNLILSTCLTYLILIINISRIISLYR